MKFYFNLLLLTSLFVGGLAYGMEGGAMNAEWFYAPENAFKAANELHQNREWQEASEKYKQLLEDQVGDSYDQEMARLNLSACLMAQRKSTKHWGSFDALVGVPEAQRISRKNVKNADQDGAKKVLVKTDNVGIGDIFHFLKAAQVLKQQTGWDVTVSVRNFLKDTLSDAMKAYSLGLVGEKDEQPTTDYTTHLIGLLGHLKMDPALMAPEEVMFTAPERAVNVVAHQIDPVLQQGNSLAVVFLGEDRQATLIGGKQLPRNNKKHGRHLFSEPFKRLLKKHPELTLMDCGGPSSRVAIDEGQEAQYMVIPDEDQPFDTIVALARIMSVTKGMVGLAADNGPTNVFTRSLDTEAQERMALIIPNAEEYDMRMEGDGEKYKQMISNCLVYKCRTPEDQIGVVDRAYNDMMGNKSDDELNCLLI